MPLVHTWYRLFEEISLYIFIDTCTRKVAFLEYLDCLRWTDIFTCHTEYTILFSYHESLFVRCWMARRFKPFVDIDRASFNTCSVCNADVKVYAYFLTPYTQLSWWVNWAPYFDSLIAASYLSFFFELGVNWTFYFAIACSCASKRYRGWATGGCCSSSCWCWRDSSCRSGCSRCDWGCFCSSR